MLCFDAVLLIFLIDRFFLSSSLRLLLIGGCETAEVGISQAASCGLSAWRVLSGSPYYKPVITGGDRVTAVSISYAISLC